MARRKLGETIRPEYTRRAHAMRGELRKALNEKLGAHFWLIFNAAKFIVSYLKTSERCCSFEPVNKKNTNSISGTGSIDFRNLGLAQQ